MALALLVATLAVAVGLALGLSPVVTRRVLGASRSLALATVVGVVVVHLVPEALSRLGAVGVIVFAAGLALPTLLHRLTPHSPGGHAEVRGIELELGFWGLFAHQIGDGLALGAYSRVDLHSHGSHTDVLLALVLHTVPLIAVVAARYRRDEGRRVAIWRAALLALGSALGILGASLVPPEVVRPIQAWVAVGVAGLLLHALTHDMTEDLPSEAAGRALDLGAALLGGLLVWLSMRLDPHGLPSSGGGLARGWLEVVETVAPALLLTLLLAAWLEGAWARTTPRARGAFSLAQSSALSPEALVVAAAELGWPLALVRHVASWLPFRFSAGPPAPVAGRPRSFLERFDARFDLATVWLAVAATVAAVIGSSLPAAALASPRAWLPYLVVTLFSVGLPLSALAAPVIALALHRHGLAAGPALLLALLAPFGGRIGAPRGWLGALWLVVVAWLASGYFELSPWTLPAPIGRVASIVLGLLLVRRVYLRGIRGWLAPILPAH